MANTIVIDELHLTVRVPAILIESTAELVRRTLLGAAFITRIRRAVNGVIRTYPTLAGVRVSVTR